MPLTTAYKSSTNVDNYRYNGKNFRDKNIFENYFINKKESLFQIRAPTVDMHFLGQYYLNFDQFFSFFSRHSILSNGVDVLTVLNVQ